MGFVFCEYNLSGNVSLDRQDVVILGILLNMYNGINIVFYKYCNLNMDIFGKLYGKEMYFLSEGYLICVERYV